MPTSSASARGRPGSMSQKTVCGCFWGQISKVGATKVASPSWGESTLRTNRGLREMNATYKPMPGFFTASLKERDPDLFKAIGEELHRQQDQIELIASENIVSRAVLEAQGSVLTNKYAEGYPGR